MQGFFTGNITFLAAQNSKPLIDAINKLNKQRTVSSIFISVYGASTLYTKLSYPKSYGVRWVVFLNK